MASLNGSALNPENVVLRSGGMFSSLACAQYAALIQLRWRIFVNGLRSKMGAFEFGARTVSYVVYSIMGLGLGFGVGAISFVLVSRAKLQYLPALMWMVFFLWQMVPIMLASFQEQFDLGTLLRFPVSFSSYYFLYIVFGLSDVSTLLGGLCCMGIWVGVSLARHSLALWAAASLLVFAAFNILLVRAIFAWIDRWLSQRRTREILAACFMVLFLSFQLLNPAVWQHGRRSAARREQQQQTIQELMDQPWAKTANYVQKRLPPGLAGMAIRRAAEGSTTISWEAIAALGLFAAIAAGALGFRLRSEYSGENLNSAPARTNIAVTGARPASAGRQASASAARSVASSREWSLDAQEPGAERPIAAVIEKEFRSLLRTLPLLYAVGAPLLMVLIISGSFLHGGQRVHTSFFAFPLCVFFAQIGLHQLFSNSMGAEGAGIQLYFLSPTPIRTVLLAKNLFHSAIYCISLVAAGILATLRLGQPTPLILAATVAWLLFVLPCSLAAGNIFSLTMPYRINPGRLSAQRGSQGSKLLGLVIEVGLLAIGAVVYEACSISGIPWMAVAVFLALTAIAVWVWLKILGNADNIAAQRKDQLIAALMKAE